MNNTHQYSLVIENKNVLFNLQCFVKNENVISCYKYEVGFKIHILADKTTLVSRQKYRIFCTQQVSLNINA